VSGQGKGGSAFLDVLRAWAFAPHRRKGLRKTRAA